MPIYSKTPRDIAEFVSEVISEYHPRLNEAGVTVGVLIAEATDKELESGESPPYLKLHGYTAAGIASITPEKQRVQGIADAVITLDMETWKGLSPEEKTALVDHEAEHVQVVVDRDGNMKVDNHGRPKLKMKLHDAQLGIFHSVIKRHGLHSIDAQNVFGLFKHYRQECFAWSSDVDGSGADSAPGGEELAEAMSR